MMVRLDWKRTRYCMTVMERLSVLGFSAYRRMGAEPL
jgi:hypothetical protein